MRLHYRKYGHGQPFLILHGLLGSSGNWHSLSRNVFGRNWATYTLDLRNHGGSPHASEMTYAAMARDVLEFAQDLHEGNVHVMGHSMGGKVAMELAISYPHIVDRLIVVDVAPRAFDDLRPKIVKTLRSLDLSLHSDRDSIDEALSKDVESAAVRQMLMKNLRHVDGRYVWLPNLPALEQSYENIAGPITAKGIFEGDTLFIRGEQSDYIRQTDLTGIQGRFPASEIVTINGAGHWVHADSPDEFARTVSEFLVSAVPSR